MLTTASAMLRFLNRAFVIDCNLTIPSQFTQRWEVLFIFSTVQYKINTIKILVQGIQIFFTLIYLQVNQGTHFITKRM